MRDKEFRSRAEALRAPVAEFLARRREERIDAQLEAGYAAVPQGPEDGDDRRMEDLCRALAIAVAYG